MKWRTAHEESTDEQEVILQPQLTPQTREEIRERARLAKLKKDDDSEQTPLSDNCKPL